MVEDGIRRRSQKGDSKIGCLFWLVVVAFAGYVLWQVVPAKVQSVELKNFMVHESERTRKGDKALEILRRRVIERAEELEIPLDPGNLMVKQTARKTSIECSYSVPINLIFTDWNWDIKLTTETPLFSIS